MGKEEEVVKKNKFVKLLIILLVLYIIGFNIYRLLVLPINNIYIKNNEYLTDQEVIDIAGIRDYPSFALTSKFKIRNNLRKNEFIKDVKVSKKIGRTVTITINEYIPLFKYKDKIILESGKQIERSLNLPIIINDVDEDILSKLVEKFINVDDEIRLMISEIKYDPNNIDKERFLFTMNDGNYVYITLYKITSINEYIKILSTLPSDKKGTLFLDSGNYFKKFD